MLALSAHSLCLSGLLLPPPHMPAFLLQLPLFGQKLFWRLLSAAFRYALPVCWCGSWLILFRFLFFFCILFFCVLCFLLFVFCCCRVMLRLLLFRFVFFFLALDFALALARGTLTAPFYGRVWVWVWLVLFSWPAALACFDGSSVGASSWPAGCGQQIVQYFLSPGLYAIKSYGM